MLITSGREKIATARKVAEIIDARFIDPEIKRFPDDELYVRLDTGDEAGIDDDVVLINNTYPDGDLVETLLLLGLLKDLGAESTTLVIPYFGYARQDKRFKAGEAVSACSILEYLGHRADRLITIDLHAPSVLDSFPGEVLDITAMHALANRFGGEGVDMVLAPDKGALARAETVAKDLQVEWDHLEKTRLSGTEVVMKPKELDAGGKRVLIVDDIISTGGTIMRAAGQLKEQGASWVGAASTHGLYTGGAIPKLRDACDLVVSTDSLESETSEVEIADVIADALSGS